MQEQALCQVGLQYKCLIEGISVGSLAQEVFPHTQIDGKDGHHNLRPYRQPHGELLSERRPVKTQVFGRRRSFLVGYVPAYVGTFVVLHVQRQPGPEIAAYVIKRIEIQPHNGERTGCKHRIAILRKHSLLPCRAIHHQVITHVPPKRSGTVQIRSR